MVIPKKQALAKVEQTVLAADQEVEAVTAQAISSRAKWEVNTRGSGGCDSAGGLSYSFMISSNYKL